MSCERRVVEETLVRIIRIADDGATRHLLLPASFFCYSLNECANSREMKTKAFTAFFLRVLARARALIRLEKRAGETRRPENGHRRAERTRERQ